jgi:hypothetical protein
MKLASPAEDYAALILKIQYRRKLATCKLDIATCKLDTY